MCYVSSNLNRVWDKQDGQMALSALLQSIQLFIFMHLNIHLWLCFCTRLTVEEEGESSIWSVSERVSSSLNLSRVGIETKMKNGPINVDELLVYEEIMKGATTPVELEARTSRGSRSPLIRGQPELSPSKVVVGTVAHFKRWRVSTLIESGVVASSLFYNRIVHY